MNPRLVLKFLIAVGIGVVCGLMIHADHERWLRAGRDAFLAYQGQRYDREITAGQSETGLVIVASLFALGICTFYEGASYVGCWLLDKISGSRPLESSKIPSGIESSN